MNQHVFETLHAIAKFVQSDGYVNVLTRLEGISNRVVDSQRKHGRDRGIDERMTEAVILLGVSVATDYLTKLLADASKGEGAPPE